MLKNLDDEPAPRVGGVSTRERGKAERRLRVIEAAGAMLAADGVEGLSMRDLSEASGVSLPTIYNLIGGRDDVLAAVLDQLSTQLDAQVATVSDDGLARVLGVIDCLLDTIVEHDTLARSVIAEGLTPMLAQSDSSLFRRYGLAVLGGLIGGAEAGELRDDAEPLLIVDQVASLTMTRTFRWATATPSSDAGTDELRAAVIHGVGLLLAGCVTEAASGPLRERIRTAQTTLLGGPA